MYEEIVAINVMNMGILILIALVIFITIASVIMMFLNGGRSAVKGLLVLISLITVIFVLMAFYVGTHSVAHIYR